MHLKLKAQYKKPIIIMLLCLLIAFLSLLIINTFSAKTEDSSWDGIVASSFTSGSGSKENPYVISSSSEFAFFKYVLESEEAIVYADKYYELDTSLNYGNYDISINNQVPFKGTINGMGNTISNVTITNSLFNELDSATIQNIIIDSINYEKTEDTGAILAKKTTSTNLNLIYLNVNDNDETNYAGISYEDNSSVINNVIINLNNKNTDDIYSLFYTSNDTKIDSVLVNKDYTTIKNNNSSYSNIDYYIKNNNEIIIEDYIYYTNDSYNLTLVDNSFVINTNSNNKLRAKSRASIALHDSGIEGDSVYVNDLQSDYDHYMSYNYTHAGGSSLPSGNSLNAITEDSLVKVYIHYSGVDVNDPSLVSYVSNTENQSEFYYYKYYPLEDNSISFELIDFPFSKRPNNKAFNGWVTDYENTTILYNYTDYTRYALIENVDPSQPIEITFNATYTDATTITSTSSISSNFTYYFKTGMVEYQTQTERVYEDVSNYYIATTIYRGDYYVDSGEGIFDVYGNRITRTTCNASWFGSCTYLIKSPSSEYDSYETYYKLTPPGNSTGNATVTRHTVTYQDIIIPPFENDDIIAGNFVKVTKSRNNNITGLYDSNGVYQSGTCSSSTCTLYELLQYDAVYDSSKTYYYLATRDTNIFAPSGNISSSITISKPMTITGLNNGTLSNRRLSGQLTINADLRLENINYSYTSNTLAGRLHNLKIGRNVTTGTSLQVQGGYSNSASGYSMFKTEIESGTYSTVASTVIASSTATMYGFSHTIIGSDYDRVNNDNSKLTISTRLTPGQVVNIYGPSSTLTPEKYNEITVKSGSIGTSETSELTAGIYMGVLGGGKMGIGVLLNIEGGYVVKIIGGVSRTSAWNDLNFADIYVKGGTVDSIIGGASYGTTYGNRLIAITGGNITYSVFGGSNGAYLASSSTTALLESSTFIYVGGHATIGTTNSDLVYSYGSTRYTNSSVEPGSIFGAGNGQTNNLNVGRVKSSVIVVDGNATINGNIYGGGNNGRIGLDDNDSSSKIYVYGGNIVGSVYGGGKNNGAGTSSNNSIIDITINGGTINNVYGGSRTSGTIYGTSTVKVYDGTINKNVYGGGEGNNTYVSKDVEVKIGTTTSPTINGSVYGGSAYGTVNSVSGSVNVTVDNGLIIGSVFGGGQGSSSYTPVVNGNIKVTINNGDISNVYGGHDQAGTHNQKNEVYLNGGTIGYAYGGGNKSSVNETHIYENGSTVTSIYGGSNTSGTVNTSNVTVASGTLGTAYGGNNAGGTCYTTKVVVEGNAVVTNGIYGGGMAADTITSNVTLISAEGEIQNVYAGGRKSSVQTATLTKNGIDVIDLFGGSNTSGTVTQSFINHNGGRTMSLYGGNNAGGNTINSNIYYNGGNCNALFGGGNKTNLDTASINVYNGTINHIYGGGNQGGATSSTITYQNGEVTDIFGGSNNSGKVDTSIIRSSGNVENIYGGGNKAEVGYTNVEITNGTITNVFGGGNLAEVLNDTTLNIKGGTILENVYGGGNYGVVNGSSYLRIEDAKVEGSIYGGGNGETATLLGNTHVSIGGKTVVGTIYSQAPISGSVFGGGNKAQTGSLANDNATSTVNIAGAYIFGNVYGGANTSVIYGNTTLNIGINNIEDKTLKKDDIYIRGHIFGGGEANASGSENYDWYFISVTKGTVINVDANSHNNFDIKGSFYGGGNASSASGESNLYINNYGQKQNPKINVSIQRVTNAIINNSSIALRGAIDRANDYDTELFSISRVNNLTIKNNSELYFVTGTNLLENFNSLNSDDTPAEVIINENNVTKTTDNRVYVYEGRNVNIAKDQQVTEYGTVKGMSFFGLFTMRSDYTVNTGNYSSTYKPNDTLSWSGTFAKGSYILSSHEANHDITKNGFYSNFMDEETLLNNVKYIEPTPTDAKFYMWFIGENVLEYNVNLTASKYSTLGSVEVSFLEFTEPNTSFEILGFDSSELASGVSLVDKSEIRRVAYNEYDANSKFGLAMEASNTGWLTKGKTSFYSSNPNISGTTYYEGENSTLVPTMLFYLYHSKNITEAKDLGVVRITVMAITKKSALNNEIRRLVINVNMSTALFQTIEYEGAMTPGDKYELFASTSNNITTKSKLSAYYALYGEKTNLYKNGYHRVLTSNHVLPLNTKITMIDYANYQTNYYYYIVDESDVTRATQELTQNHEVTYALSSFIRMGNRDTSDNYDDASMNNNYFDGTNSSEEFIFIVDFNDAEINGDMVNNRLLIELRDEEENTIYTVLGIEHNNLTYNLYANRESKIDIDATADTNPLYIGYSDTFDINVNYQKDSLDNIGVIDTQYFNSKLGVQIKIYNKNNKLMSGTDLVGIYFEMDGNRYYPDVNGITHIKLAEKVGNLEKWIILNSDNSSLPTGEYHFVFEAFGSLDGIYYSSGLPDTKNLDIMIINSEYGLNPTIKDESTIFNSDNDKDLKFSIQYESLLENPNIRLSLYRRNYNDIYDTTYELVDLRDYLDQDLFGTENDKEYLLINDPNKYNDFTLKMSNKLLTGTYRLIFKLYDNDVLIGEITRYIIIK